MTNRAGYVLTGGRSSRFGDNKALAQIDDKPMAVHVVDRILPACQQVTLVGAKAVYGGLGLPVVEDSVEGFGPVAGMLAALESTSAEWNHVVACDMPNVTAEFSDWLFQRAEAGDADAVIPQDREGRPQPLCAVYRKSVAAPLLQSLEAGTRKVRLALDGITIDYVAADEYGAIDPDGEMLLNVNRPEDLARYR